jgi:hypothetical protein
VIVLDEHLEEGWLHEQLLQWYQGAVVNLTDLRPNTTIKDDAVPALLRTVRDPTFVTINIRDFWRKIEADRRFGVVCIDLADKRKREMPALLRGLFALEPFKTRAARLGKVVLILPTNVRYYTDRTKPYLTVDW